MLVQRSYGGVTKDDNPRSVPVNDSLLPVLAEWLRNLGRTEGLVFPPSGHGDFVKPHRLRDALRSAQKKLNFPCLTWYQSTRHTFASHWVMDGRPIEKLRVILGHSTVQVTERYAHLSPDAFGKADYAAVFVDLTAATEPSTKRNRSRQNAEEGAIGHNRGTSAKGGTPVASQVAEIIHGEMAEWPKAPDSKSGLPKGNVGSTPTLSSTIMETLGGFPNPPALWLWRPKPAFANAVNGNHPRALERKTE